MKYLTPVALGLSTGAFLSLAIMAENPLQVLWFTTLCIVNAAAQIRQTFRDVS